MKKVDLHTHTTASDGKTSPRDLVQLALKISLHALAITDHDTVNGIPEALAASAGTPLTVIPGIEVSTLAAGQDIHILGYYIAYEDEQLAEELANLRATRHLRNQMMLERLHQLGIAISYEEVRAKQLQADGNVGRPHIAEVLIDKGIVQSMDEAFSLYLGRGGQAYVNPPRISPAEGIALILKYKGIPVLAHPGLYGCDHLIEEWVQAGLLGLEVYHPDHSPEQIEHYKAMAAKYKLIVTGGSDFHGLRQEQAYHGPLGSQPIFGEVLEELAKTRQ